MPAAFCITHSHRRAHPPAMLAGFVACLLLCLAAMPAVAGEAAADSALAPPAAAPPTTANDSAVGPSGTSASASANPQNNADHRGKPVPAHQAPVPNQGYSQQDIVVAANDFFGGVTQGLAEAVQKVFSKFGEPNAYIIGNEGGGAFIVGLRYGIGTLQYKGGQPMRVYWQGPSAGFDFGGNASKTFMLVYGLKWTNQLFQRFPGVAGSLYVVAGLGLNYLHADGITIAPIRTGVGLRAGANVGYLGFSKTRTWNPF